MNFFSVIKSFGPPWANKQVAPYLSTTREMVKKNSSRGHQLRPFFVAGLRSVANPVYFAGNAGNPIIPNMTFGAPGNLSAYSQSSAFWNSFQQSVTIDPTTGQVSQGNTAIAPSLVLQPIQPTV